MTNEEARRWLESQNVLDKEYNLDAKAIEVACEALEKQIPIQPISKYLFRIVDFVCPSCETKTKCRVLMPWEKHCPDCGQAIDWSEEK